MELGELAYAIWTFMFLAGISFPILGMLIAIFFRLKDAITHIEPKQAALTA